MAQQDNVLKSVDRVLEIIKHLKDDGGKTVTELAADFDMPKSTIQMYLNTLYARNFVVKNDGRYEVGLQFLEYGMFALWNQPVFPEVKAKVEELAESTGELAACFVEERGEAVYIYGTEGEKSIRTDMSVGDRTDLHCTANGKALLAHLPEERIEEVVSKGLDAKTDHTVTDPDELYAQLDEVRDRGYAYARQESVEGMRAVAAPILLDGDVVASISLAGPANRFVGQRFEAEIPEMVTGVANEIELKLTYSESGL
jgi:DNA-binding IclR family transcriptional regulator